MIIPAEQVIDIRELRIGNYLEYDGKIVHVTMLSADIDDEYNEQICFCELGKNTDEKGDWNRALCDKLRRIIITPEWMDKFGFITLDAETDIVIWGLDDNSNGEEFSIESDGLDSPTPLYFAYDLGYGEKRKEIKYVHQLQNLYFWLMDKELIITP